MISRTCRLGHTTHHRQSQYNCKSCHDLHARKQEAGSLTPTLDVRPNCDICVEEINNNRSTLDSAMDYIDLAVSDFENKNSPIHNIAKAQQLIGTLTFNRRFLQNNQLFDENNHVLADSSGKVTKAGLSLWSAQSSLNNGDKDTALEWVKQAKDELSVSQSNQRYDVFSKEDEASFLMRKYMTF